MKIMPELGKKVSFKSAFVISLLCSIFVCAFSILGGELDYPGNDDTFRNLISVGAFGEKYNYYIPCSNVLYGIPIAFLNRLFPMINWYYWVMLVISIIAISLVCTVLFNDFFLSTYFLANLIINLVLSRDYYVAVQFTKTASLWFICGICIIVASLLKNNKLWISGVALLLLGLMCRLDCAKMLAPFAFLFVIAIIFRLFNNIDRIAFYKNALKVLVILAASLIVLAFSETYFRKSNAGWNEYWEFEASNAEVIDRGMSLDYNHDKAAYDLINTDNNDLELYSKWQFGDPDFYNLEWFRAVRMIESQGNKRTIRIDSKVIKMAFTMLVDTFVGSALTAKCLMLFAFCCSLFLLITGNWIDRIFALGNLLGCYGAFWYFSCINRFMWRVECGVFLALLLFVAIYIRLTNDLTVEKSVTNKTYMKLNMQVVIAFLAIIMFMTFSITNVYNWRYVKDKHIVAHEADITGRLNAFREHPENFYILTDFYVTNNPMSITRSKYKDIYENSSYIGNWTFPAPNMLYYAKQRGYDNPMRSLVEDNVYLYSAVPDLPEKIRVHLSKVMRKDLELYKIDEELWKIEADLE